MRDGEPSIRQPRDERPPFQKIHTGFPPISATDYEFQIRVWADQFPHRYFGLIKRNVADDNVKLYLAKLARHVQYRRKIEADLAAVSQKPDSLSMGLRYATATSYNKYAPKENSYRWSPRQHQNQQTPPDESKDSKVDPLAADGSRHIEEEP